MRIVVTTLALTAVVGLAACSQPKEPTGTPDTAATAPAGATPAEPSIGSPPDAGGGVPGSSEQSNDTANPDGTNKDAPLPRETPSTPDA